MNSWIDYLTQKYARKGIIVDTNLLLLILTGQLRGRTIQQFKNTEMFTLQDYELLINFIRLFSKTTTTQSILTEASNLLGQFPKPRREVIFEFFAYTIRDSLSKIQIPSVALTQNEYFAKFGLTDVAIVLLAQQGYLVITTDSTLASLLTSLTLDVIDFSDPSQKPPLNKK